MFSDVTLRKIHTVVPFPFSVTFMWVLALTPFIIPLPLLLVFSPFLHSPPLFVPLQFSLPLGGTKKNWMESFGWSTDGSPFYLCSTNVVVFFLVNLFPFLSHSLVLTVHTQRRWCKGVGLTISATSSLTWQTSTTIVGLKVFPFKKSWVCRQHTINTHAALMSCRVRFLVIVVSLFFYSFVKWVLNLFFTPCEI